MRLNPGLKGGSNEAQRNHGCQQSNENLNENEFEPWAQQGGRTRLNETRCQQSHANIHTKLIWTPAQTGFKWGSTKSGVSKGIYKWMKTRLGIRSTDVWIWFGEAMKTGLSLGSTWAQMKLDQARDVSSVVYSSAAGGTVRENYDESPAANRTCKEDKAKLFQTFLPRLNWAVWENKLESHIGWYICVPAATLDTNLTTMLNGCRWLALWNHERA